MVSAFHEVHGIVLGPFFFFFISDEKGFYQRLTSVGLFLQTRVAKQGFSFFGFMMSLTERVMDTDCTVRRL